MATRSTMVYSAAAVRRLLGLGPATPVQLQEFAQVIWVWVKGQRPTFISKKVLKAHFVQHRQREAAQLRVTDWLRNPGQFTVANELTGSRHLVTTWRDRLECSCEDYHWQVQYFSRGCCKHGYAVLQYLGFESLRDYLLEEQSHKASQPAKRHRPKSNTHRQLDLLAG